MTNLTHATTTQQIAENSWCTSSIECSKLHAHPPPSSISSPLGNFECNICDCIILHPSLSLCKDGLSVFPPNQSGNARIHADTISIYLSQPREAREITGISIEFLSISQPWQPAWPGSSSNVSYSCWGAVPTSPCRTIAEKHGKLMDVSGDISFVLLVIPLYTIAKYEAAICHSETSDNKFQ